MRKGNQICQFVVPNSRFFMIALIAPNGSLHDPYDFSGRFIPETVVILARIQPRAKKVLNKVGYLGLAGRPAFTFPDLSSV